MAGWKKLLQRMLTDDRLISYTYSDAARILTQLGFQLAPHSGGSHRVWRGLDSGGKAVIIGLVDSGKGTMKPYLVRDMLNALRASNLIPPDAGVEP